MTNVAIAWMLAASLVVSCGGDGASSAAPRELGEKVARATELWRESCPVPGIDGVCGAHDRVDNADRCGPAVLGRLSIRPRDPEMLARARAAWAAADDAAAPELAAEASFGLLEGEFEAFVTQEPPLPVPGDDYGVRLMSWKDAAEAAASSLAARYESLIEAAPRDSAWIAAAHARTGATYRHLAVALERAPVPLELQGDEQLDPRREYCDALDELAAGHDTAAASAFERCRASAAAAPAAAAWATVCARAAAPRDGTEPY